MKTDQKRDPATGCVVPRASPASWCCVDEDVLLKMGVLNLVLVVMQTVRRGRCGV